MGSAQPAQQRRNRQLSAVVTLACTGVVSVKHCSFSIDWKWDFWNCLEAVGTIGATFVALFGFSLKEIREKRWAVAKVVWGINLVCTLVCAHVLRVY